jgi:hypothetical protein
MANTFKSSMSKSVGTAATSIYTVPAGTTSVMVGCTIANTVTSPVTCEVMITRAAQDYYLVKNALIPTGSAFVWTGGEQKTILQSGDTVKVAMSAAGSADVILSYLEVA